MRALGLALLMAAAALGQQNPRVIIETSKGSFTIELFQQQSPRTVENFLRYVDLRYYDDTIFHRVIPKFVVQGGGFTPELQQKPTLPSLPIETKNGLTNERGTVAMARDGRKDSATSQFFVNLGDNEALNRSAYNHGYTVFGRVIDGMETVDAIADVQTSVRGPMKDVPILPVFLDRAYRLKE